LGLNLEGLKLEGLRAFLREDARTEADSGGRKKDDDVVINHLSKSRHLGDPMTPDDRNIGV
jgi:hypothetical protein